MANQITEVRLLSVPLENDYKHTLYFGSLADQVNYFLSKTVFSESDFTYQRKDHIIRYPKHYDELSGVNYVMYRNPVNNKWIYAFITEKTYINEERTDISIETDVIQTYLFDYTVKPSFVEREHTDDDTRGLHTIPENLECGEFISELNLNLSDLNNRWYVVGVTAEADGTHRGGGMYCGMYSGIAYYGFASDAISELNEFIASYDEGRTDAIKVIFVAPAFLGEFAIAEDETETHGWIAGSEQPKTLDFHFPKLFAPYKNNKLNCFPYRYILVSNNNGGSAVYHYEHFSDEETASFKCYGALTPGCSIRLIPLNYKGVAENNEEGLNLGKYPICNWASDEYTNWLTQNSVNIALNIATGVGQVVAGVALAGATGGVGTAVGGGQIAGGASGIAAQLAQIYQMSFTPPQARGNINCGDVTTVANYNTFTAYSMTIKPEYAEILDNYFSMFGYKCNRVKTPLKNHRENYWYTKTIDASIDGNISNKDLQAIKNCYNSGITFWKNASNIGDYSVSNTII